MACRTRTTLPLVFLLLSPAALAIDTWPPECNIEPPHPRVTDEIRITLSGEWFNGCIPNDSTVMQDGDDFLFDAIRDYPPDAICAAEFTPWSLSKTVGILPQGTYTVVASLHDSEGLALGPTPVCTLAVGAEQLSADIKPGSCPNSFNRGSHGVLPVAVLGTEAFDVTTVDLASVEISRADGVGGSATPHEGPPGPHSIYEDVATPFDGETCDCHEPHDDGFMDLSMKFKTNAVVENLLLSDLPPGALVELRIAGSLLDGTPFTSSDCIRLVPPGTSPGMVTVQSSVKGAWIDVEPLDLQLDGGGFGDFERTYPQGTAATFSADGSHAGKQFLGWRMDDEFRGTNASIEFSLVQEFHALEAVYMRLGDIDGNDTVNLSDFALFAQCFGVRGTENAMGCSAQSRAASDLDGDLDVDLHDFLIFVERFGN